MGLFDAGRKAWFLPSSFGRKFAIPQIHWSTIISVRLGHELKMPSSRRWSTMTSFFNRGFQPPIGDGLSIFISVFPIATIKNPTKKTWYPWVSTFGEALTSWSSCCWWYFIIYLEKHNIFIWRWYILLVPSGKLTQLRKITIFNGKIHYKWPFSIAMLIYQRVI